MDKILIVSGRTKLNGLQEREASGGLSKRRSRRREDTIYDDVSPLSLLDLVTRRKQGERERERERKKRERESAHSLLFPIFTCFFVYWGCVCGRRARGLPTLEFPEKSVENTHFLINRVQLLPFGKT